MSPRRKKEWFDDNAYWRELYPSMFTEERFAAAPEQIEKVLALAEPIGKAALDLCCGPGRCSIALARAGFRVTGVDKTKFLLDKARAKARAAKVKIEWVHADMRDFARPEAYDFALSMWTSFGYFDDKREDIQVLENILTSLKPGGVVLLEMMGKERLARMLQPDDVRRFTRWLTVDPASRDIRRLDAYPKRMDPDSKRESQELQVSSHNLFRSGTERSNGAGWFCPRKAFRES